MGRAGLGDWRAMRGRGVEKDGWKSSRGVWYASVPVVASH